VVSPLVTWAAFRRVPLWRTLAEPLAGAVLGASLGAALGSGVALLLLAPLGLLTAMVGLGRRYRGADRQACNRWGTIPRVAR
jgi:hypothetical protein